MDLYGAVMFLLISLPFGLTFLAALLNLRCLTRVGMPIEFKGLYGVEDYKKAQAYSRAQIELSCTTSIFMLLALFCFWYAAGFRDLDRLIRAWTPCELCVGLVYIVVLLFARWLLSIPFRVYSIFVIDDYFGFNRTKLSTFISDNCKTILLSILLGGPVLAGLLSLFSYTGLIYGWLYCGIAASLVIIGIQVIAPAWILPLFNNFRVLEQGPLRDALLAYAQKVGIHLKGVFIVDTSRRTGKAKAFLCGFGRFRRIALSDTLIENLDPDEVVAVLAHEVGHDKKRHAVLGVALDLGYIGLTCGLMSLLSSQEGVFYAFNFDQPSAHASIIIYCLLLEPLSVVYFIGAGARLRALELEADRFAVESLRKPELIVQAIKKISVRDLFNLTPHPLYVLLNYSHPPVLERIQAIRRINL